MTSEQRSGPEQCPPAGLTPRSVFICPCTHGHTAGTERGHFSAANAGARAVRSGGEPGTGDGGAEGSPALGPAAASAGRAPPSLSRRSRRRWPVPPALSAPSQRPLTASGRSGEAPSSSLSSANMAGGAEGPRAAGRAAHAPGGGAACRRGGARQGRIRAAIAAPRGAACGAINGQGVINGQGGN